MDKSVFIVGHDRAVHEMFLDEGWVVHTEPNSAAFICFTGGADVDPGLYGEKNTRSNTDPARDAREIKIYAQFKGTKNFLGICRGGQFLNVMNGGRMIQHIDGHSGDNLAAHPKEYTKTAETRDYIRIREDHHQAMLPTTSAEIFLVGLIGRIVEGCMYKQNKSFCFQPHPEWGHDKTRDLFFAYIQFYFGD